MQLLVRLQCTYMEYSLSPATRNGQNAAGPVTAVFLFEGKSQPDFLHQARVCLAHCCKEADRLPQEPFRCNNVLESNKWLLERREEERIATILSLEHAQQEAVHREQDTSPNQNSQLLSLDIRHTRNLQCKSNCCE